ncbi:unnamed protein product [Boreogadus saida]
MSWKTRSQLLKAIALGGSGGMRRYVASYTTQPLARRLPAQHIEMYRDINTHADTSEAVREVIFPADRNKV